MSICARSISRSTTANASPRCWSRKEPESPGARFWRGWTRAGSHPKPQPPRRWWRPNRRSSTGPEEIAQSRANVASAKADQVNALQQWTRLAALTTLTTGRAVSEQDLEAAKAALDSAQAHLAVADQALELAVIGPRKEDIAQGEAQLRADQAQLELLHRQLADAELVAPGDAVVRNRLLEPGEMVSPQRPVLDLAITDPKWVRAYVSEPDLGKIHPGMKASISTDGFPDRPFSGWVGFISSVAEFTPKAVETVELRSSLVYEIRVFVRDPQDQLRLGMPATVLLELNPAPAKP